MSSAFRKGLKTPVIGCLALAVIFLLSACSSSADPDEYVFFSGGESGVYYPTAQVIARVANEAGQDFRITVKTSGGSIENARALGDKDADFALIQSDIAVYAREGGLEFEDGIEGILGLAALYPEHVQIVALADSGIETLSDLTGRAVAIGAQGSGTAENAREILDAAGLGVEVLSRVENLSATESVDALAAGAIDAAFFTFGLGTPAIEELAREQSLVFVPVDGEVRERLLADFPYYSAGEITSDSYTGLDGDVSTVTVTALLVARDEVPDDVVQAVLEALFKNRDAFAGLRLAEMTVESAEAGLSLPLHPGAERFYAAQ